MARLTPPPEYEITLRYIAFSVVLIFSASGCQETEDAQGAFTDLGGPPKIFAIGGGASSSEGNDASNSGQLCIVNEECDDDDRCTADSCDTVTGVCIHFPIDCPEYCDNDNSCYDGNPCTVDGCGEDGICKHDSEPDCTAKECAELKECDDGDPCTQDGCLQGWCNYTDSCGP